MAAADARLSRGQCRYRADADWGVLEGCTYWRNLTNTIEPSVCGVMWPYVKLL